MRGECTLCSRSFNHRQGELRTPQITDGNLIVHRIWHLGELMNNFRAYALSGFLLDLERLECHLSNPDEDDSDEDTSLATDGKTWLDIAKEHTTQAKNLCLQLGFSPAYRKAELTEEYFSETWRVISLPAIENEMRNLKEAIANDINKRSYLYVHSEHVRYVDNDAIFGKAVAEAFPSASDDLKRLETVWLLIAVQQQCSTPDASG